MRPLPMVRRRRVTDLHNPDPDHGRPPRRRRGIPDATDLTASYPHSTLTVGVLKPGGVATELGSHNKPEIRDQMIDPFYQQTEVLAPEDIAYMITRSGHTAIGELWIMPTD